MGDALEPEVVAEAERYSVPPQAYADMTPRERGLVKAHWTRRTKAEAKRLGVSTDWWMSLSDDERKEERERRMQEIVQRRDADDDAQDDAEDNEDEDEDTEDDLPAGSFKLYTEDPDVPIGEQDPRRRDGMTIGKITEIEPPLPDVLGTERERHPRTLMDLYHRWPVGDGEHHIRVERTQPKQWQQIACAGYLGDIREPISEKNFQQFFGGREYELTLYGPDPRGKSDPVSGLPRIKALTNPIKITVPVLPPNLAVLPAMLTNEEAKQEAHMTQPWNPFAPSSPNTPTTPADAQVHKSNVDLVTNVLKMTQEENRELRKAREGDNSGSNKQLLDWQKEVLEGVRKDSESRERILRDELEAARRVAEKKEEEIEKIRQQIQQATGRTDGTTLELVKTLGTSGAEREAQRSEYYRQQLDLLRTSHQEALRTIEERQRGEIARADERLKQTDDYYKKLIDELQRKADDRERTLKDEIERVRRDERDASTARTVELKERYEERLRDQEKSFEREIRTVKENWDVKLSTTVSTKDFELAALRERLEEAKEEAAEARAKAEESKDPAKVIEDAKRNAELFGYAKTEDAPKTPWERFAATAGAGLGQALQNIDQWLPQAAAALSGGRGAPQQGQLQGLAAPAPPQLTAAAAAARAAQQPRAPRPRGVAWAAAGQPPTPGEAPETPMGFQPEPSAPPAPPAPTNGATAHATPASPQPQPQQAPPSPPPQQQLQVENTLGKVFGDEAVLTFLNQMDVAINMGMEPAEFARRFLAGYAEAAVTMIRVYKPDDVTKFVKTLPGSDMSAILRRDGTKFVTGLWSEIEKQSKAAPPAPQPAAG